MKDNNKAQNRYHKLQLRRNAEAQLAETPTSAEPFGSPMELMLELRVHRIELEMQNEELRQAQLALEESRDLYVDLYEFAPVGYLTLDPMGVISKINLTGAGLLGNDRVELIYRRFARYVEDSDHDRWHRLFLQAKRHTGKHSFSLQLKRGDGTLFHAHLDCLSIEKANGSWELRVTLTDVSERKLMEVALEAQNEAYHSILEATLDGFLALDRQGRLLDVNSRYVAQSGYTREELLGLSVTDLDAQDTEAASKAHFQRVIENGGDQFQSVHKRKDGSTWPVEVSATYLDSNGGRFFVFVREIGCRPSVLIRATGVKCPRFY